MKALLLVVLQSYMAFFARESEEALKFFRDNRELIAKEMPYLNTEERKMALAIVAPEVSQYSKVLDFVELRTLFIFYRSYGRGDFSVGQFQMKPSFIEALEAQISKNSALKKRYGSYLPKGDDKTKRETRLNRLMDLQWQLRYLQVFIDVVKGKTAGMKFASEKDKLKYWATLYNSGFNISQEKARSMMQRRLFPHNKNRFNYADVAWEFYQKL